MRSILNLHYRDHGNAGDMACSVAQWFQFKNSVWHIEDIHNAPHIHVEDFDAVIIGGGGLLNEEWKYILEDVAAKNKNTFLWGVGTNTTCRSSDYRLYIPRNISRSKVFLRDYDKTACPSLHHPALKDVSDHKKWTCDQKPVGYVFSSALRPFPDIELPDDADSITTEVHYDELLSYIRNKETIVTNSYHAALWAWRMGKKIALVVPDKSKFHQLGQLSCGSIQFWSAWNPDKAYWSALKKPEDWLEKIDEPWIAKVVEQTLC